jgi:osmoprotectant transport system permease protein
VLAALGAHAPTLAANGGALLARSSSVVLADPVNDKWHWDWVGRNSDIVWDSFEQQLDLTYRAVLIGVLISIPLAIAVRGSKVARALVIGIASALYTVPSLAALTLLGPFTGYISRLTVDIVLVSYTLVILLRNIVTGLDGVPPDALEAARGMGLSRWQQLVRVELPLALPSIMAGIRLATVTTIGLATLASVVAQGGLGYLIIHEGFDRQILSAAIVGSGLAVGLAIVSDAALVLVQRLLSPWARKVAS